MDVERVRVTVGVADQEKDAFAVAELVLDTVAVTVVVDETLRVLDTDADTVAERL